MHLILQLLGPEVNHSRRCHPQLLSDLLPQHILLLTGPWIPRRTNLDTGIQVPASVTHLPVVKRYLCHVYSNFHDAPNVSHKVPLRLEAVDGELDQILVLKMNSRGLPLHVFFLTVTIFPSRIDAPMIQQPDA